MAIDYSIDYLELTQTLLDECPIEVSLKGYSMYPTLRQGYSAIIEKCRDFNSLKTGDLIAYRNKREVVCHRVVRTEILNGQQTVITRGDNNKYFDLPVYFDNIFGKLTAYRTLDGVKHSADGVRMKFFRFLYTNLPWTTRTFFRMIKK